MPLFKKITAMRLQMVGYNLFFIKSKKKTKISNILYYVSKILQFMYRKKL